MEKISGTGKLPIHSLYYCKLGFGGRKKELQMRFRILKNHIVEFYFSGLSLSLHPYNSVGVLK